MKVIRTAISLGETFDKAQLSFWDDKKFVPIKEQIQLWKEKFHASIHGGHFDHVERNYHGEWNTKDAIVEFDSEEDYFKFILEWS